MHDRPDLPCVVDEHRLVVAQCWDDGHTEDECEANARLIAAAPELYEGCKRALNYIENTEGEFDFELDTGIFIRAALAKARGESGQ
jgi:hypothetical protein